MNDLRGREITDLGRFDGEIYVLLKGFVDDSKIE